MSKKTTRRNFMASTSALSAACWVGGQTLASPNTSALQSLACASVGVGGKGSSDCSHIAQHGVKMVGICDVDQGRLTKKGREKEFADAKQFLDFREMMDQLGDKFDMVTVSTPDHTHAVAAIKAMKMGKHCYCQKPLTWSIREARMMREVAAEKGVVTQMGNQGTSTDGIRTGAEIIKSGAIGEVKEVHVWTNRPVWPQGIGRPEGEDAIPEGLNWDAWIGPAPMRPFKDGVYHSFKWRGWADFGTGALGDMACHTTNLPVMALKLWDPTAVTAIRNPGIYEGETFPERSHLMFEFPERDGLVACDFHWYDGGELPPDDLLAALPAGFQRKLDRQRKDPKKKTSGALIVGSKGMLFSENDYGEKYQLLPEDKFVDFKAPEQTLPRIPFKGGNDERQKWEFVETCKGDYAPGTMSNFNYAGRLTETILVGNLAMRSEQGVRIEWDAENLKSTNVPEVNQFIQREYRSGWEL